jgi:hypothetical protein
MAAVFAQKSGGAEFIGEVERRHVTEMKYLVPSALAFNIIAFVVAYSAPSLFANPVAFAVLGGLQFLVSLVALIDCVRNFRGRSSMLAASFR